MDCHDYKEKNTVTNTIQEAVRGEGMSVEESRQYMGWCRVTSRRTSLAARLLRQKKRASVLALHQKRRHEHSPSSGTHNPAWERCMMQRVVRWA